MPPKKEEKTEEKETNDIKALTDSIATLVKQQAEMLKQQGEMSKKIDTMVTRIEELDESLKKSEAENAALRDENRNLRDDLVKRDTEVERLRNKTHLLEMHNRSFSVRVSNMKITGDETDPVNVRFHLYQQAFLPILHAGHDTND